ncbi:MAG TPA: ADP-ribosylglycohydrolase family protein [Kineosporiaceae bacterium]|nr:ADP-ribosylglycohydrolase family protein [Kineosporiaceae bacterium]
MTLARSTDDPDPRLDRARGALWGLAVGDALGMPTQLLTRAEVVRRWGPLLAGLEAPDAGHPIAAGLPAGSITDDTEQAVLLGRLLVEGGGHVEPRVLAGALIAWEEDMRARGSADLLGPSTTRAVQAIRSGVPVAEAGRSGDTNGAAMRVAPVGVARAPNDLERLVDAVVEVSRPTHGTSAGLAGAAAVAAAVSVGVTGGNDVAGTVALAVRAAELAAARGVRLEGKGAGDGGDGDGDGVAERIARACDLVRGRSPQEGLQVVVTGVGTGMATRESVPAAFALLTLAGDDPWLAVRLAASAGGDADTVAAMAGAMAGARTGASALPPDVVRTVREVNGLDLDPLAADLLALRRSQT